MGVVVAGALGLGVAVAAGACGENRGSVKIEGPAATSATGTSTSGPATTGTVTTGSGATTGTTTGGN